MNHYLLSLTPKHLTFLRLNFFTTLERLPKTFLFLFLLCLAYPQMLSAQGATCSAATTLTINGPCNAVNPTANIDTAPLYDTNCGTGGAAKDIGWYVFTVTGGPLNVTVTAIGTKNIAFQLISRTGICTGLIEIACVNAKSGSGNLNSTETITQTLANGTYYIKVLNTGNAGMTLTSLCITASIPPAITSLSSANGCVGSSLIITGTNLAGATAVTIGGTVTTITANTSTTVTVTVGIGTTGTVKVTNSGGTATSGATFTVNPLPANPGNPTSNSPQCNPPGATLTRTGTPPTGETWYWQTAANGTSITNSGATYTVSTSGTYYIRARNNSTGCWSVGAGNLAVTASTGISAVASSPAPANAATEICYQGFNSVNSISWSAVAGATSYDVYFGAIALPGTLTANVTTNSYNTGILAANTTYFWRVVPRNACGTTTGSPGTWKFTTAASPCIFNPSCSPKTTSAPQNTYIMEVSFLGTLNDVSNASTYTTGYQNFTALPNKTKQAAGEGINVFVKSNNVDSIFKAWVDWNKTGIYDNTSPITPTTELVYSSGTTRAISTTFGIVIPPGTLPGDYTMRIRNYRFADATDPSGYSGDDNYNSCTDFSGTNYGEAEDYVITVVANCAANLDTVENALNCGLGSVTLSGKGTVGTTSLRWYDAQTGGNLLAETLVDASLNATVTTPTISATTIYYVTAFNGFCESIFRRPVIAKIKPVPNITFDLPLASANFCGDDNTLKLTSSGEQEQVILIEENFDSGLGLFTGSTGTNADFTTTTDTSSSFPLSGIDNSDITKTGWQNKSSTSTPVGSIWKPAISSGFGGNKFAFATSDYATRTVHTILTSTGSFDTTGFTNLNLTFSAYYSYYGDTSPLAGGTVEGLFVEVSTNGGSTWTTVQPYYTSLGIGTAFQNMTVPLSSYLNVANLKVRFRYIAYWADGVAIDNIKLFGDKPLSASFVWTAPNIGIFQSNCLTPYVDGTPTSSVCIKPTDAQLQTIPSWNISAVATLSNGCTTTGVITVQNNNKVWDTTVSTTWGATDKWLPTNEIPDIGKCVIIKKPVSIINGDGFAKNIIIAPGGSLNIKKDRTLTVTDYIKNETTPLATNETNFVVETDGNLIQLNSGAANSGRMTAQRNVTGLRYNPGYNVDYVYWSSPVLGQKTKGPGGFSPGTSNSRFYQYRESNDRFYETPDLTFTSCKGYAVQAESNVGSAPTDRLFEFKGTPNNGDISIGLAKSPDGANGVVHGYNLVGNPYPSNINFEQLKYGNDSLIWGTAWFWTNNFYTASQMGSGYAGNNYAIYNGTGGVAATSPYNGGKIPNGIIKVGQAFIVQAKSAGTLNFKNKYDDTHILRVKSTGDFYSKDSGAKNRFWISLLSPTNLSNSQLIAYVPGATDDFEQDYDAEAFDTYSDLFYSVLTNKKLVIQGKGEAFTPEDKVTLGANFFQNGSYTISLDKGEGIFDGNQSIYLKDKQLGIVTNLNQGSYTFTVVKGDNTGRFEILYKPEAVLATGGSVKEQIIVYRDATDFVVKSPKPMSTVEVYDNSGKLFVILKPNGTTAVLDASTLPNGGYVLKIKTKDGEVTSRKIVR